jgi:hypothetical protein
MGVRLVSKTRSAFGGVPTALGLVCVFMLLGSG